MDDRLKQIRDLSARLQVKDMQLKQAVALAGRAAEDLKKYRDLTVNLDGLRQILFHQRNQHKAQCKDEGCEWDLGTLAFLAHSMGMKAPTIRMDKLRAMIGQYDSQHSKQVKGHVHEFPKGVTDAGRSVQPDTEGPTKGLPVDDAANVQGPRPDSETTRRLPDKPGSTPISE